MAENYLLVRASQIQFFKTVPFYYRSKDGDFLLYKKTEEILTRERADANRYPPLFIHQSDKEKALKELTKALNTEFSRQLAKGGLAEIKTALSNIVREALTPDQETAMLALPGTLDIFFSSMDRDHTTMEYLAKIATTSDQIVEHTVNVMALTLQYCFFMDLPEKETTTLALCALLHDVGVSKIDRRILESQERLSEKEFNIYKTHAELGHDMIILSTDFDVAVANVALEHHERLDKSGYPNGTNHLCRESQLISMIDSYEALTYHSKPFRKAKSPFNTLHLIKDEVIAGKFSKQLFKNFTSCLTR